MNDYVNSDWIDQLAATGINVESIGLPNALCATDSLHFMDRSDLGVVSFRGADVDTFLQSQTCNDHAKLTAELAQLNGYCSPKGRLLALPLVASDGSGSVVYWLLPKDIVEATVKRLTMFVLRADVQIAIESDWAVLGLESAEKTELSDLAVWVGNSEAAPLTVWEVSEHFGLKARSQAGVQRALWFGPADAIIGSVKACVDALPSDAAKPVCSGAESWWWGDIDAGVPAIVAATRDAFVPQMVNLEPLEGLSFTKGCYPGQEIVARMQYLGKLKRTMVRFTADAALSLSPGDSITAGDDENAGVVVTRVTREGVSNCLAVIKTSADQSAFRVDGVALNVQTLPYA